MNILANNHNKMLHALAIHIAQYVAIFTIGLDAQQDDDHQQEK